MDNNYCYFCKIKFETNRDVKKININEIHYFVHKKCYDENKYYFKNKNEMPKIEQHPNCYYCAEKFLNDETKLYVENFGHFEHYAHEQCYKKYHANDKNVNHPQYYGGEQNVYEVIKIIEHYKLGFCLGNTLKYILRAGKKDEQRYIEDLEKAQWYLQRKINQLKNENK